MLKVLQVIIAFIAIFVICIFCFGDSSGEEIFYTYSVQSSQKVKNNTMACQYVVSSLPKPSPKDGFNSIQGTVSKIKNMIESVQKNKNLEISNLKIDMTTNTEWNYTKNEGRKLVGYIAYANISYNADINEENELNRAFNLQNSIVNTSTNDTIVKLESVQYYASEYQKEAAESVAIEKGLKLAKFRANELVEQTYPDKKYQIISLDMVDRTETVPQYEAYSLRSVASDVQADVPEKMNAISQGETKIKVKFNVKITVF